MTIGSQAFVGEACKISVFRLGAGGSEEIMGRLVNSTITGFNRQVTMERTFGAYLHKLGGFQAANVQLSFVYDQDDDTTPMIGYVGSESTVSGIRRSTLIENQSPTFHKVKFEFNEYTDTFGQLNSDDKALRLIFYNAYGVTFSTAPSPTGQITGTITFHVLPFNEVGSSNFIEIEKNESDSVGAFISAESSYDTELGY